MAVSTIEDGWGDSLIRSMCTDNFVELESQETTSGVVTDLGGMGATQFIAVVNANLALYIDSTGTDGLTLLEAGDSWDTITDKMNTNFTLLDTLLPQS